MKFLVYRGKGKLIFPVWVQPFGWNHEATRTSNLSLFRWLNSNWTKKQPKKHIKSSRQYIEELSFIFAVWLSSIPDCLSSSLQRIHRSLCVRPGVKAIRNSSFTREQSIIWKFWCCLGPDYDMKQVSFLGRFPSSMEYPYMLCDRKVKLTITWRKFHQCMSWYLNRLPYNLANYDIGDTWGLFEQLFKWNIFFLSN